MSYYNQLIVRDVYTRIIKTYSNPKHPRPMMIHKSYSAHSQLGAIFFAVTGSPPKGYAVYVPEHKYLIIIDAWGKTKRYKDIEITDLDQFKDDDILEAPQ